MRNSILISILILFISGNLLSQTMTILQKADDSYSKKRYTEAIAHYNKALKKKKKKNDKVAFINFRIAECYRHGNHYTKASEFYAKAIKARYKDPIAMLHYSDMQILLGNYEHAIEILNEYLEYHAPDNSDALQKIASCKFAIEAMKDTTNFTIMNIASINTEFSEYGIGVVDKAFIFSSTRKGKNDKEVYSYTGQGFSHFYETVLDVENLNMNRAKKVRGDINSEYNDGTFTWDKKNNQIFFMQCNGPDGKDDLCRIFTSEFTRNRWAKPVLFTETEMGTNVGHPSISEDGNTLFFVSDHPAGKGKTDIWMIEKKGGNWREPVNVGEPINTSGREMFPYIKGDTLYFASDGHPGFGGLDIFYSIRDINGKFTEPVNMKRPVNSSADDFNIIFVTETSGFFCSNRPGGMGDDDVYSFRYVPVKYKVSGLIADKDSNQPLEKALVIIAGSNGSLDSLLTDPQGKYTMENVIPGIQYSVKVSKNEYFEEFKGFGETANIPEAQLKEIGFVVNFNLMRITKDEIVIQNIYYDYDKWDLRDTSKYELDKIVLLLSQNPDIKIMINSHTDDRGAVEYNRNLSEKRAESVVKYLITKGIASDRLAAKGWGKSNLIVANAATEEEHQKNRRTTFNIMNVDEITNMQRQQHEAAETSLTTERVKEEGVIEVAVRKKSDVSLKVQFAALSNPMDRRTVSRINKAIPEWDVEHFKDADGLLKYVIGELDNIDDANELKDRMRVNGYEQAFIVAFKGKERIKISEALKLLGYE